MTGKTRRMARKARERLRRLVTRDLETRRHTGVAEVVGGVMLEEADHARADITGDRTRPGSHVVVAGKVQRLTMPKGSVVGRHDHSTAEGAAPVVACGAHRCECVTAPGAR